MKSHISKKISHENSIDDFNYEVYCKYQDEGFKDRDIARDLNISEKYFNKVKYYVKDELE